MNKVILMGRLVSDPELRYTDSTTIAKYTLAVNRKFKREGEPDADFINCVAFGKSAEFADKYFKKGMLVAVVGSLRISTYIDKNDQKRWSTDVILDEQNFAEPKRDNPKQSNYDEPKVEVDLDEEDCPL